MRGRHVAGVARQAPACHQQPADISFGPGYEGRGGWSWYTGAAARMLSAAYALFGLEMVDGQLRVPDDAFVPRGHLQLRRVVHRGLVYSASPAPASAPTAVTTT